MALRWKHAWCIQTLATRQENQNSEWARGLGHETSEAGRGQAT